MYTWSWFSQPGFLLAIVAILVGLIYKLSISEIFNELWLNVKKMKFSALTIGTVVALAYVMGDSGQNAGTWLVHRGCRGGLSVPRPDARLRWDVCLTGSDTSANILFSNLQSAVGQQIGGDSALGVEGMRHLLVGTGAAGQRRRQDDLPAIAYRRGRFDWRRLVASRSSSARCSNTSLFSSS